jgi:hypothetical protein
VASDLIPPPSPAGRPSGDAEAERERAREREEARRKQGGGSLWSRSRSEDPVAEVAQEIEAAEEPAPARAESPYRSRFGLVLGALLGVAIATLAIGAAVYVGTDSNNGAPAGWSSWKPDTDDGVGAAKEIATHVGRKYRLDDGGQIVGVEGGRLELDALGLTLPLEIAMKTAAQGGDIQFIKGNGVLYTLNGLGPNGALPGKPTKERALLLRREALELVLYTFRYVKDVDLVVTLLPPATLVPRTPAKKGTAAAKAPKTKQTQALFFRPGDLEPQLEIPLAATIPQHTPRPATLDTVEASRIATLTKSNLFGFSYQQAQNQKAYLVLERLSD